MVKFVPFRGFRYNYEFLGELGKYLSPLFDVVTPGILARLYANPLNSIHLAVPQSVSEAEGVVKSWKKSKILVQDALPTFYLLTQKYPVPGTNQFRTRRGIIGMIKLDPPKSSSETRNIILHEDTVQNVVQKQTKLLKKTLLNVAPTHGFYYDENSQIKKILLQYEQSPLLVLKDYQGVVNYFSLIQNQEHIREIVRYFQTKKIFLADGHHRLKSSETLQEKMWEEIHDKKSPLKYHLMFINNFAEEQETILPINRKVKNDLSFEEILKKINTFFKTSELKKIRRDYYEDLASDSFIMSYRNRNYLLQPKPEALNILLADKTINENIKSLPYTHLHYFIIDKTLGIPYKKQMKSEAIQYLKLLESRDPKTELHPNDLFFFMPGLPLQTMMHIAESGALMPPKSTYFYPKLNTGFVFASVDGKDYETKFDIWF